MVWAPGETKCAITGGKIREGFPEEVPFELGLEECWEICQVDSK